jgi:hypothetical protein
MYVAFRLDRINEEEATHHVCIVVGSSLTSIVQRIVDVTADIVNFSPLVMMCATLIQHNKAQSRVSLL